jgi:lipid-binding SYLF domain-containing protein
MKGVTQGVAKGAETAAKGGALAKLAWKAGHLFKGNGAPKLGRRITERLGHPSEWIDKVGAAATGLHKEHKLGPVLSTEVDAAIRRMTEHDPGLKGMIDEAYGYAVFPLVGKATAALGVGYGRGEVFERGKLIGYCGIVQLTLGVQVGGQTYDELILFQNQGALERFKSGNLAFAMNASAVIVKAGAAATTDYSSATAVFVHPEGGMMLELGLGGQKFIFREKVLGAPQPKAVAEHADGGSASQDKQEKKRSPSAQAQGVAKQVQGQVQGAAEQAKGAAKSVIQRMAHPTGKPH